MNPPNELIIASTFTVDPPSELIVASTFVLEPEVKVEHFLRGSSLGSRPTFFLTTTLGGGNAEHDTWTSAASGHYFTLYHGLSRFRVALMIWIANNNLSSYFSVIPIDGEIPPRIRNSIGILRVRRDFVVAKYCTPVGRPVFADLSPYLEEQWDKDIPRYNQLRVASTFPDNFPYKTTDYVHFVHADEVSPTQEETTDGMVEGLEEVTEANEEGSAVARVKSEVAGGLNRNHIERAVRTNGSFCSILSLN